MATERYTLNDTTWTLVAEANETFLIENETTADVFIRYDTSTPSGTDIASHRLTFREGIVRVADGAVYAMTNYEGGATVAVSTGVL